MKNQMENRSFWISPELGSLLKNRKKLLQPADQQFLKGPLIGVAGSVSRKTDLELVAALADLRPEWQWILLGSTVAFGADELPRKKNLKFLGPKDPRQLPCYFSGWDAAILPLKSAEDFDQEISSSLLSLISIGCPVISTDCLGERLDISNPDFSPMLRTASCADELIGRLEEVLGRGRPALTND